MFDKTQEELDRLIVFVGSLWNGDYYLDPRKLLTPICNRQHWEVEDLPDLTEWLEKQLARIK